MPHEPTPAEQSLTNNVLIGGGLFALLLLVVVAMGGKKGSLSTRSEPFVAGAPGGSPADSDHRERIEDSRAVGEELSGAQEDGAGTRASGGVAGDAGSLPSGTVGAAIDLKAVMRQGEQLYHACGICHGLTGEGVPGQYPPLKGAPYVVGSPERLARILLHGLEGPTVVLGREYDLPMPAAPLNDDEEVAAVMTFIRQSFGNRASAVRPELVAKVRAETQSRESSWTAAELDALP